MSEKSTIYVLYNAKASLLGKLSYGYKKLSASSESSPCSACDLTHGGLRLSETAEWKVTKERIDADVVQLHTDELSDELDQFVKAHDVRFPVILGTAGGPVSTLKVLINSEALRSVSSDHEAFLSLLSERAATEGIPLEVHGESATAP